MDIDFILSLSNIQILKQQEYFLQNQVGFLLSLA